MQNPEGIVDNLFREHYRHLVATLTASVGPPCLELAEDAVSEALFKALKQWPFHGVPKSPRAWLLKVARNHLLDRFKRTSTHSKHEQALIKLMDREQESNQDMLGEHRDEELAMMFMSCHPSLQAETRVPLTLKVVGGFSVAEIARGFLAKEATIAQRLVRARRGLAQNEVALTLPEGQELRERLNSVLDVIYLMFTEGHMAHQGDHLVRQDICGEAIRLGILLADHPKTGEPRVSALVALMHFVAARFPGRMGEAGEVLLMQEQDRSKWDRQMLHQAMLWLRKSAQGNLLSAYHLEAEIAACHSLAPSLEETDWQTILKLYDQLRQLKPSPIIELNRSVVIERLHGVDAALRALADLGQHPKLQLYFPYHLTRARFQERSGDLAGAVRAYKEALEHCTNQPIRENIIRAISALRRRPE